MQRGNVFVMSACLCVCLCVCVSIQAVTFEAEGIETFFLAVVDEYPTISRSNVSTEITGPRLDQNKQAVGLRLKATLVKCLFHLYLLFLYFKMSYFIDIKVSLLLDVGKSIESC